MINDWNNVGVIEGSWTPKSKCNVKGCNRGAKFMVFNDDGKSNMSRLFHCCCGKHLPLAVRKAWSENRSQKLKLEQRAKKEEMEEAKKLLGVSK